MATPTNLDKVATKFAFGGYFPVRKLRPKFTSTDGGEWIIAYKAEQRRQLKATMSSLESDPQGGVQREADVEGELDISSLSACMDRDFLLKHLHVDDPADIVEMDISGNSLHEGNVDLSAFKQVVKITANDNSLPLETFDNFVNLKELELSLNCIKGVKLSERSFRLLEILDLSYNHLNDEALLSIGLLPALKELHLTGNNLIILPADMSRPIIESERSEVIVRYPCLERLWLDDNQLCDCSTFSTLAGLKRLKELYLDNNEIYNIPYLRLLGVNQVEPPSIETEQDGRFSRDSIFTPVETKASTSDGSGTGSCTSGRRQIELPSVGNCSELPLPFPQLELLSISNNLILRAEGLLAVKLWPKLKSLRIHGNPLSFTNKGMPVLLQQELIEDKGLSIIRRASELRQKKEVSLAKRSKEIKKVSQSLPPLIPKQQSSRLSLEAPPPAVGTLVGSTLAQLPGVEEETHPTLMPTDVKQVMDVTSEEKECSISDKGEEDSLSGVFLTQINNEEGPVPSVNKTQTQTLKERQSNTTSSDAEWVKSEFQRRLHESKDKWKHLPSKFRGYECFLDATADPSIRIPNDVLGCTKSLRTVLHHPLLLPAPGGAPHALSSPQQVLHKIHLADVRAERMRGMLQVHQTEQNSLPAKVRHLESLLAEIKHDCLDVDMSLSDVLSAKEILQETGNTTKPSDNIVKNEGGPQWDEIQRKFKDLRKTIQNYQTQSQNFLTM